MSVVLFNVDNSREGRWFRASGSYGCVLENACCHDDGRVFNQQAEIYQFSMDCKQETPEKADSSWDTETQCILEVSHKSKGDEQLLVYISIAETIYENMICMKVNGFSKQKVNAISRGCCRLLFGFNIYKGKVKNGELKTDCSQLTTPLKNKNRPNICVYAMFTTGFCQMIKFLTLSLARNALKLLLFA